MLDESISNYTPASTKLKGGYTGITLFVCPSVDRIMSALYLQHTPWWRHQMETFSSLLAICAGNSLVPSEFPTQKPVTRSFDVSFDLPLNKQLSKHLWGWWFETLSGPLWRHSNASDPFHICTSYQATSEGVSRVMPVSKFKNLKFWRIFKICNFDFVFFWLGIQYDSTVWVIIKRRGVSSERRHSSCSSLEL